MRKLQAVVLSVGLWLMLSPWLPAQYSAPSIVAAITQTFNSTANGAASTPAARFSGSPFTGGTGTTTKPLFLLEPTGTTSTGWNTNGTFLGINAPTAFAGRLMSFQREGVEFGFVTPTGFTWSGAGGIFASTGISVSVLSTNTNCANAASPAVCASAASGSVAVPDGGTTLTVNTTRVTANSQIHLTFNSSQSARLSVTCNTTIVTPTVSAKIAATSFTITLSADPAGTDPVCVDYSLTN